MSVYNLSVTTACPPQTAPYLLEKLCDLLADYGYGWLDAQGTPVTEGDAVHGDVTLDGDLRETPYDELCPRCMRTMVWATSSWHCLCGFHSGCCEGEPQS